MKKGISALFVLLILFGFQQEMIGLQSLNITVNEPSMIGAKVNIAPQQDTTKQTNTTDTIPGAQKDTINGEVRDTITQDTLVADSLRKDTLEGEFQEDTTD